MKILNLHLYNIKRHKDRSFNFDGLTTMILGANGSGKSTIVESIFYALFRKLLVTNVNDMINQDIQIVDEEKGTVKYSDKAFIELEIEHKNERYLIKSGLAKTTSSLKIWKEDKWVEKINKITEMYEFIKNDILDGMTNNYFINTIYTEQMGILNLVSKTDAIRQKEFDKLIGIDRFQKIHDCLAQSYTKLNKLSRNDIDDLRNQKISLKDNIDELDTKLQSENDNIKKIQSDINQINTEFDSIHSLVSKKQSEYDKIFSSYITANDTASKINFQKEKSKQLDDELKTLLSNKDDTLSEDYDRISKETDSLLIECKKIVSLKFNFDEAEIEKLNDEKESLMKLNNSLELINMHEKEIKDLKESILKNQKTKLENEDKIANLSSDLVHEKEIKDLQSENRELKNDINKLTLKLDNTKYKYQNDNYNQDMIESYFNDVIDEYTDLKDTNFKCLYCQSNIDKEIVLKQLKSDKLEYISLSDELDKKQDKYDENENIIALLTDVVNKAKANLSVYENEIKYNDMVIKDFTEKINHIKIKIHDLKNSLSEDISYSELIIKLNNTKEKIQNLINDKTLEQVRNFRDYDIKEKSDYDINLILEKCELWKMKNLECTTIRDKIKSYHDNLSNIQKEIDKISIEEKELNEIFKIQLKEFNVTTLEDFYALVNQIQDELNIIKSKQSSYNDKINHLNEMLNISNRLVEDINQNKSKLNDEVLKIDKIIDDNIIIEKRIKMVNVAKAYFKQDGLAKYIRRYYINKINENMTNYVHLFNFDFIPVIDDTAGIEHYERYSGGQKIAIAILMKMIINFILKNPINIMILDEPTPYMDSERIEAIKELVDTIKDKLQTIVITHDIEFMNIDCNKISLS